MRKRVTQCCAVLLMLACMRAAGEPWLVEGAPALRDDPAVSSGLAALQDVLADLEDRGALRIALVAGVAARPADISDGEWALVRDAAYQWNHSGGASPAIEVTAEKPLGLAYGLYALADEIAAEGEAPRASEHTAVPALPYRALITRSPVPSTEEGPETTERALLQTRRECRALCRKTLRHGYNFLVLSPSEDYIPWLGTRYQERSKKYLAHLDELLETAHEHHLKLLLMGDEFVYLPEYLEQFGAALSVKAPQLWEALQQKYRDLFDAAPELDGITTRIGEQIPRFEFRTLDVIHSDESEPDPRIEERYRQFINAVHEVAVEEHGKWYLHRTWVTNAHEQHSVPQVYSATFNESVPQENLLLAIKMTAGDQWYYYEPFNPTFGESPHTTLAQAELYSGYHGFGTILDYPALYFQSALQWAAESGSRGVLNTLLDGDFIRTAIFDVFSRLAWDPYADVQHLTRQWAARTLGHGVASETAKLFSMAPSAIRDGLYIGPVALHTWNPLPHFRVRSFVVKGNPLFDHGRGHHAFLRTLYVQCRPWLAETVSELDQGVRQYRAMLSFFETWESRLRDRSHAEALEQALQHGAAVLELNRDYVRSFLLYFRYREEPDTGHRARLAATVDALEDSVRQYVEEFGLFSLQGIHTYLELAHRALENIEDAERVLRMAPTEEELRTRFARQREEFAGKLHNNADAVLVSSWKGTVDGRDVLELRADGYEIEHISADPVSAVRFQQFNPMPTGEDMDFVLKHVDVPGAAYLMEAPAEDNKYTARIYLEDPEPGAGVFHIRLYAIPRQPAVSE